MMNIYEVRFAVNKDNTILCVEQFGKSEEEIQKYWTTYFNKGRRHDEYTFIDCVLKKTGVNCPYGK